jgi:molybdate transport system permease protein
MSETSLYKLNRENGAPDQRLEGLWRLLALPLLFFLAIPLTALFLRITPLDLWSTLQQPVVFQAIRISLLTSLGTVAVTIVLGTPVAYLLTQHRSRWYRLVDTLVDLPTVLPPAVAGVALLVAFGRRGLVGTWLAHAGISLPFTPIAVIMAQTFIAAPLYIKAAAIGFSAVDRELQQAAALDGANFWQTFRYVTIPLAWSALVTGSVMTWARALGEFGATIIFAGNFPGRTQTMPLAIYLGFEIDLNVAVTLSLILIIISSAILVLVKSLLNREHPTPDTSRD